MRAFGNFNQFTASDVGQAGLSFDGRTYGGGAEASYNVFQHRDNFIDLVAGARYEHNSVDNGGAGGTGTADFVVPYGGLRYEQIRDVSSLQADLMLVGRFSNAGEEDLNTLGRLNADSDAVLIQADASHSFFLEPIFRAKKFREAKSTLANEMVFSARAQYSLNRLIPAAEEVAGGLYSVRGYPESIGAGDTVLIGSAEYSLPPPAHSANAEKSRPHLPVLRPAVPLAAAADLRAARLGPGVARVCRRRPHRQRGPRNRSSTTRRLSARDWACNSTSVKTSACGWTGAWPSTACPTRSTGATPDCISS